MSKNGTSSSRRIIIIIIIIIDYKIFNPGNVFADASRATFLFRTLIRVRYADPNSKERLNDIGPRPQSSRVFCAPTIV